MRDDNDFADVTLACEDGQQVEAHKVILAGQVLFDKLCCFMLSNAVLSLQFVDLAVFLKPSNVSCNLPHTAV